MEDIPDFICRRIIQYAQNPQIILVHPRFYYLLKPYLPLLFHDSISESTDSLLNRFVSNLSAIQFSFETQHRLNQKISRHFLIDCVTRSVRGGHLASADLLLEQTNFSQINYDHWLFMAVESNHMDLVQYFNQNGGRLMVLDYEEHEEQEYGTVQMALQNKNSEIASYLIRYGDATFYDLQRDRVYACRYGCLEILQLLLSLVGEQSEKISESFESSESSDGEEQTEEEDSSGSSLEIIVLEDSSNDEMDYEEEITTCIEYGQIQILRWILDNFHLYPDVDMLILSAFYDQEDILKEILSREDFSVQECAEALSKANNLTIQKILNDTISQVIQKIISST